MGRPALLAFVFYCLALGLLQSDRIGYSQELSDSLSETDLLEMQGDIASELVEQADNFLLRQLSDSVSARIANWPVFGRSGSDFEVVIEARRERLRKQIGMVDPRLTAGSFRIESNFAAGNVVSSQIASGEACKIYSVSWPVFEGVDASGMMLAPTNAPIRFCCVLIPDASQSPEQLCGIGEESMNVAVYLANQGGLVVVPSVLSRTRLPRNGRSVMTDQEYIYRSAFVLGRHVLGYMVNETLAAVDIFSSKYPDAPVVVAGWGEGGWIALHAGVVDTRIAVTCVSGHFGPRERIWSEPIHRNVQGLLTHFGDAQLGAMIAPRRLVIDPIPGPIVDIAGEGGAPGSLSGPSYEDARMEFDVATELLAEAGRQSLQFIEHKTPPTASSAPSKLALDRCLNLLELTPIAVKTDISVDPEALHAIGSVEQRRKEVVSKWDRYQQRILESVAIERKYIWDKLNATNFDEYPETVEGIREMFQDEVIGDWDKVLSDPRPRTRLIYEEPKWVGYEVVLDVFDEVFAYGVLLLPRDGKPLVNRPCVVFQHGLEGRPQDTIAGNHEAYHDVSVQLVKQGYVVFAPQNLYLFHDRFRTLQRKSNPLGKTLFSLIVPQHRQVVRWLGSRPEVDPKRIAFYGLSYGGKSAMRIPALVPEYCLSICSADFNDWVWKNASTTSPYSYVWTNEYEIFEFGLGRSFNYSEMAALIAPRPFMVERGHHDGVASDERVASEYAKVKRLYTTILQRPDDCQIEWFDGPHTINGKGTFDFLKKHLQRTERPPNPKGTD